MRAEKVWTKRLNPCDGEIVSGLVSLGPLEPLGPHLHYPTTLIGFTAVSQQIPPTENICVLAQVAAEKGLISQPMSSETTASNYRKAAS